MTFAHVLLLGGGVLVLLVTYGLIRRAGRRRGYRLRDLTDLSSGVDPDWERYRRTMRRPDIPRQDGRDAEGTGRPPEEKRSS